jgi:spore coat protein JB
MNKQQRLFKIQKYNFAAYDMLLYLDTHPDDKKAFMLFRDLVQKLKKLKYDYEEEFGPLTAYNAAAFDSFKWLDSPWPWEKEANK